MSNSSTPQQRHSVENTLQERTPDSEIEFSSSPAEVFVQSIAGLVNQHDVETMIRAQKQMLQRFEKTNEMLLNCNALSQSRLKTTNDDFRKHVKLLTDMKKDLDYIFRKIRVIKQKLSQQYPIAYAEAQPQRSSLAEEAEDETEQVNFEHEQPSTSKKCAIEHTASNKDKETIAVISAEPIKTITEKTTNTATTVEYVQMEEAVENGKPIENDLIKRVCSIETANPNDSSDCTSEDTG